MRKLLIMLICSIILQYQLSGFYTVSLDKTELYPDKKDLSLLMNLINSSHQDKQIFLEVEELVPSGNLSKLKQCTDELSIFPQSLTLPRYKEEIISIIWNKNKYPINKERIFYVHIQEGERILDANFTNANKAVPVNINYRKRIHVLKSTYKENIHYEVEKKLDEIEPKLVIKIKNKGTKSVYLNNGIVKIRTNNHDFSIDLSEKLIKSPFLFPKSEKVFVVKWPEDINQLEKIKKVTFRDKDNLVKKEY